MTTAATTTSVVPLVDCASCRQQKQSISIPKCKCLHWNQLKHSGGMESLLIIQQYLQYVQLRLLPAHLLPRAACTVCTFVTQRLFCCLHCQFVACGELQHAAQHADGVQHWLAVELSRNQLYCFACRDVIYDAEFENLSAMERTSAQWARHSAERPPSARSTFAPWWPTRAQADLLSAHSRPVAIPPRLLGLRGLNNLGNTCFMNSILQALLHNPLLRNFFASDQHNRKLCLHRRWLARSRSEAANNAAAMLPSELAAAAVTRASDAANAAYGAISAVAAASSMQAPPLGHGLFVEHGAGVSKDRAKLADSPIDEICLACEMDYLVAESLTNARVPFSPHQFLYSVWRHSNTFAGYEQQDAHEFLMCVLNGIHANCGGTTTGADCNCIVHSIFSGVLRSDVTCRQCGNTSTASDPFIDISLELPRTDAAPPSSSGMLLMSDDDINGGVGGGGGGGGVNSLNHSSFVLSSSPLRETESTSVTLAECLQRFTRPEKLGRTERANCSTCQNLCDVVKQLSFRSLPSVICFHLKRFEQGPTLKHSHKIDTHVSFPDVLDMSPYVSNSVMRTRFDRKRSYDSLPRSSHRGDAGAPDERASEIYELFAVVNHSGQIDNGHYTCAVRHGDDWIKCDDAALTSTTFASVAASEAYLLFYVRSQLSFDE